MKKNIVLSLFAILIFLTGCDKKVEQKETKIEPEKVKEVEQIERFVSLDSKSRPYAFVVNNFPSAIKAQTGLNDAYIIYEFPIEGGISRSLALFRDRSDVKIGTIRSARQNYLDYALENDAIFVHFGRNFQADTDLKKLNIDNIDGHASDSKPFVRENNGLAREHTVYTNLSKIIDFNNSKKKYRTKTEKLLLNYVDEEIDLSKYENNIIANDVVIPYSSSFKIEFKYNSDTKKYERYFKGQKHTDYMSGEVFDTKNIIVTLVSTNKLSGGADAAGNSYLNILNIGKGKGYYITNGYALPIEWQKASRSDKTKYIYNGKEINVKNDNTYIMLQNKNYKTIIN